MLGIISAKNKFLSVKFISVSYYLPVMTIAVSPFPPYYLSGNLSGSVRRTRERASSIDYFPHNALRHILPEKLKESETFGAGGGTPLVTGK